MLKDKKIAVLGAGKLGETLIKGLLEAGVIDIANVKLPVISASIKCASVSTS
jgi:pyrroline-5-carboxylate reductase